MYRPRGLAGVSQEKNAPNHVGRKRSIQSHETREWLGMRNRHCLSIIKFRGLTLATVGKLTMVREAVQEESVSDGLRSSGLSGSSVS